MPEGGGLPGGTAVPADRTRLPGFTSAAVLIGASTGGPPVVEQIVRALPADFPAPVAICQHMSPGFVEQWAERLSRVCWLPVKEAEDGERFGRGCVYLAPVGRHLRFRRDGRAVYIRLDADFADSFFVPSIDYMFSSAAEIFGGRALGVLLTGIGSDGALGMLALRRAGAYTLIQDPESAAAPSMPTSAAGLGAAMEEASAGEIARIIVNRASGVLTR